jgi:F-type H+-transporting ATPase subunit a
LRSVDEWYWWQDFGSCLIKKTELNITLFNMSNNSYNLVAQDNVLGFSFFDQFEILRLVDLSIGGNLDLSITNSTVFLLVAFFVLFFLFKGNNENGNIVPGRYQSILEGVYVLVYDMVKENMGKDGARYFPFMLSLFLFLLIINFVGLIPYTFTPTSHGAISFGLSISIFVGCAVIAFATHGMDYFSMFFPPGVAAPIAGFLVAVEIISYFAKPISLGLRLAANITAGHLLFTILASFI